MRYKFYIVSGGTFTPTGSGYATISGGTTYDIEKDFDGLLVSKIKGLDDKGEIKNRYTETYADSEKLRVYHPTTPLYKETTIKLDILFSKALRGFELDAFTNLIKGGTLIMYETSRGRCFEFVYMKDTIVSDEKMYGGQPYKEVEFELQNIRGYCDRFVLEVYNIAGVSTYTAGRVYYNGKGSQGYFHIKIRAVQSVRRRCNCEVDVCQQHQLRRNSKRSVCHGRHAVCCKTFN